LLTVVVLGAGLAGCGSDDAATTSDTIADDTVASTAPDEPITVDQLVARSADSPIAVTGLVIVEGDGPARLCELILESYPPQCGGATIELVGLDVGSIDGATSEAGVTWKEGAVFTVQRTDDGRFDVIDG
jgi:hypothetical protein